jgi:flagellin-like hook-associated protein FlgL
MMRTADQALDSISSLLRRLRDLTSRSANGDLTNDDRSKIQAESDAILREIDRVAKTTEYNTMTLLDGNVAVTASADRNSIAAFKHLKVTDNDIMDGEYSVKVLRDASYGKGAIIGKVFTPGENIPEVNGSFASLIGSQGSGTLAINAGIGDSSVSIHVNPQNSSIREVMDQLQEAFRSMGEDVEVNYLKPSGTGSSVTWDSAGIISEPINSTVPVVWNTSPWSDDTIGDTLVTLNFTSATTFEVVGNATGSSGVFNLGDNVDANGLHLNLSPDMDGGHTYSAGDQIRISVAPATRKATFLTSNTGITSAVISGYNTITDGLHTISATTNPYQISGINTTNIIGELPPVSFGVTPSVTDGLNDTSIRIQMTGANSFNVVGNISGALGSGTTGSLFTASDGNSSFNLNPDPSFEVGDVINLSTTRRVDATITGSSISAALPISLVDGINDQFAISIDGVSSTIDLTSGLDTFNDGNTLAAFMQSAINSDPALSGAGKSVSVSFTGSALRILNNTQGAAGSISILNAGATAASPTLGLSAGASATGQAAKYNSFSVTSISPGVQNLSLSINPANTARTEQITLRLIGDNNGADVWSVTGSVTGAHNDYISGTSYTSDDRGSGGGGFKISFDPNSKHALNDRIYFRTGNNGTIRLDTDSTPSGANPNSSVVINDNSITARATVIVGNNFRTGSDTVQVTTTNPSAVNNIVYNQPAPVVNFTQPPALQAGHNVVQDQSFTLTLVEDNDGADRWSVVGSASGVHADYISGTSYISGNGSNGWGSGMQFQLDPSARYHVGSQIVIGVNTDRPRIEVTSDSKGSARALELSVGNDQTGSLMTAVGSEKFTVGNQSYDVTQSTIVSASGSNPFDNLGIAAGNFFIRDKSGTLHTVAVNAGDRISDIVTNISALSPDITASWNSSTGSLLVQDNSAGSQSLKIFDAPGSFIAEDLEIAGEAGSAISGRQISRTRDYVLEITGPDGTVATVRGSALSATNTLEAGRGFDGSVKANVNDSEGYRGGVLGLEIALNEDMDLQNANLKFTVSRGTLKLQGGDEAGNDPRLSLAMTGVTAADLGLPSIAGGFDLTSQESAQKWIDQGSIDAAISKVSELRGQIGAFSNRIDHSTLMLSQYQLNISESESRIRDTDVAKETIEYLKTKILNFSSLSILSKTMDSKRSLIGKLLP